MPFHKCSLCSYTSHEYTEFTLHMRSHDGEGPSYCSVCGRYLYCRNGSGTAGRRTNSDPPANPGNLHEAAVNGLLDHVKDFLSKGADINSKHGNSTALIKAAEKGHLNVMHHLIHAGANVNLPDSYGITALLASIFAEVEFDIKKEMVITLLHAGANPNIGMLHHSNVYSTLEIKPMAQKSPAIGRAAFIGAPDIAAACLAHGARQLHAGSMFCCYGPNVSDETKEAFQEVLNNPLSLENQAIRVIRSHIMNKDDISELPLPPPIKKRCLSLHL